MTNERFTALGSQIRFLCTATQCFKNSVLHQKQNEKHTSPIPSKQSFFFLSFFSFSKKQLFQFQMHTTLECTHFYSLCPNSYVIKDNTPTHTLERQYLNLKIMFTHHL